MLCLGMHHSGALGGAPATPVRNRDFVFTQGEPSTMSLLLTVPNRICIPFLSYASGCHEQLFGCNTLRHERHEIVNPLHCRNARAMTDVQLRHTNDHDLSHSLD